MVVYPVEVGKRITVLARTSENVAVIRSVFVLDISAFVLSRSEFRLRRSSDGRGRLRIGPQRSMCSSPDG
jgi:hypothetical protein